MKSSEVCPVVTSHKKITAAFFDALLVTVGLFSDIELHNM
jgi:hypothetical protein